ncbi:MAG TPA: hypothetical protein VK681_08950 [Reyranella sp.]|nr:hypothetical protein [Reyranella sp.]
MKHGHGNDGPATPASVAHRGLDLFDHRHGWEDRDDGHHHDSPANAPDLQDGVVAVIGGRAAAANTLSAAFASAFAAENHFLFVNAMAVVARQGRLSIRPAGSVRWHVGRLASCPEASTP